MRIVVTGASGFVGSHVAGELGARGHTVVGTCSGRRPAPAMVVMDLLDPGSIERAVGDAEPDGVVHAAAWPELLRCEQDPDGARRANVNATAVLARACARNGARLVFLSTDQVFDGERGGYAEADEPAPVNVYGRTKLDAEQAVASGFAAAAGPRAAGCVLRLSLVYGTSPGGQRTPVEQILAAVRRGERPRLFADEFRTPVFAEDAARACEELLTRAGPPRLLHLGGPDRATRYELGLMIADRWGFPRSVLERGSQAEMGSAVHRPRDVSLDSSLARSWLIRPPRTLPDGLTLMWNNRTAR